MHLTIATTQPETQFTDHHWEGLSRLTIRASDRYCSPAGMVAVLDSLIRELSHARAELRRRLADQEEE